MTQWVRASRKLVDQNMILSDFHLLGDFPNTLHKEHDIAIEREVISRKLSVSVRLAVHSVDD